MAITTADRSAIHPLAFQDIPISTRRSLVTLMCQPMVTPKQQTLWTRALHLTLTTQSCSRNAPTYLYQPLGAWLSIPNQKWEHYYDINAHCILMPITSTQGHLHTMQLAIGRSRRIVLINIPICPHSIYNNLAIVPANVAISPIPGTLTASFYAKQTLPSQPLDPCIKKVNSCL